jgi:hypothetical protein
MLTNSLGFTRVHANIAGHAMQPAGNRVALPQVRRLLPQHNENGLRRIFGILPVAKLPAASTEYHCRVPLDKSLEARLTTTPDDFPD